VRAELEISENKTVFQHDDQSSSAITSHQDMINLCVEAIMPYALNIQGFHTTNLIKLVLPDVWS
jgi:hypothetical protein